MSVTALLPDVETVAVDAGRPLDVTVERPYPM